MSKVLITGGAGFVGSHLVDRFLDDKNYEVTILDNFSIGRHNLMALESKDVEIIEGAIESNNIYDKLPKDIDTIIHLAAMNRAPRSIKDPVKSNDVNITGTLKLLEFSRENNCKFVFISSSSVFGHLKVMPRPEETNEFLPSHPYGLGKMASEHYCRLYSELYNLDTRIIRYFAVYGPRQSPDLTYSAVIPKFIKAALKSKPITIFGGDQSRNFTFVKDTVEATFLLATAKKCAHQTYQVSGTEKITIEKLVSYVEEVSNKKLERIYKDHSKGDIFESVADMANLKADLNFTPKVSFIDGLKETYSWFQDNPNYFS
ncbi:MAG: NAD-dependent epimerase/dehydratase family protein [Candidatus Heimdallarchaeota archaeon]